MDKEKFKKLVSNPDFISGIYNYCDRWCERCMYTTRCATFAVSEEQFKDPEKRDIDNKEFWDTISEAMHLTRELLEELAAERGINLDDLNVEEAVVQDKKIDAQAKDQPWTIAAKAYGKMVMDWFESAEGLFERKQEELNEEAEMELPGFDPDLEADTINDAVEVIHWYSPQVFVKLMRATSGKMAEAIDLGDDEDFPRDSDGSAKVALIGIDRSIAAWGTLYKAFPSRQNDIIDMLVHLDRLRRASEQAFPHARAFVRPGFDAPVPQVCVSK